MGLMFVNVAEFRPLQHLVMNAKISTRHCTVIIVIRVVSSCILNRHYQKLKKVSGRSTQHTHTFLNP